MLSTKHVKLVNGYLQTVSAGLCQFNLKYKSFYLEWKQSTVSNSFCLDDMLWLIIITPHRNKNTCGVSITFVWNPKLHLMFLIIFFFVKKRTRKKFNSYRKKRWNCTFIDISIRLGHNYFISDPNEKYTNQMGDDINKTVKYDERYLSVCRWRFCEKNGAWKVYIFCYTRALIRIFGSSNI